LDFYTATGYNSFIMKTRIMLAVFLMWAVAGLVTGPVQATENQEERALAAARERYITTYNQADWEAHGAMHQAAAAVMMPNGSIIEGREAIVNLFSRIFGDNPVNPPAEMNPQEIRITADWAWERGSWGRLDEPPLGWYLIIWQKDPAGEWLADQVIYTSR